MPYTTDIKKLYKNFTQIPLSDIPFLYPSDHTMDSALTDYVNRKLPVRELSQAIAKDVEIKVMGIFDPHFEAYCKREDWIFKMLAERQRTSRKRFNFNRPKLYSVTDNKGKTFLVFTVMPGYEYVKQYGWFLRQFIDSYSPNKSEKLLTVAYDKYTCDNLGDWSDLVKDSGVKKDDVVILGYVDEFSNLFDKYGFQKIADNYSPEDSIYGHTVFLNNKNQRILLLGVTYSYWGSIIGRISDGMYQNGAKEIIYAAKCGTLADEEDIYKKLIIPRSFAIYENGFDAFVSDSIQNNLREFQIPEMTGLHVSVPTVVGETYDQREDLHRLGATSIDNELSHLAISVQQNQKANPGIIMGSVHFSTDYVRRRKERGMKTSNDLSTGRSSSAKALKASILTRIGGILFSYLSQYQPDDPKTPVSKTQSNVVNISEDYLSTIQDELPWKSFTQDIFE